MALRWLQSYALLAFDAREVMLLRARFYASLCWICVDASFQRFFVFSVRLFFNGCVLCHSAFVHRAFKASLPDIGMD